MLFLRSWLEEYVTLDNLSNDDLAHYITIRSSEVDDVQPITEYFNNKVVVGKVSSLRKHPNADTLHVCDVIISPDASQSVPIVSGAPNMEEGMYVAVALEGAKLPYLTIASRQLRGELSGGMCCGKSELALETEYSKGLWNLEDDAEEEVLAQSVGKSVCTVMSHLFKPDCIFDIKILPDRYSQLGSHLHMAYEISRILPSHYLTQKGKDLTDVSYIETQFAQLKSSFTKTETPIEIIDTANYMTHFSLYEVTLSRSYTLPHLFQTRMMLLGQNLIGGLADLSNYILLDQGHPNHVFSHTMLDA